MASDQPEGKNVKGCNRESQTGVKVTVLHGRMGDLLSSALVWFDPILVFLLSAVRFPGSETSGLHGQEAVKEKLLVSGWEEAAPGRRSVLQGMTSCDPGLLYAE